MKTTQNAIFVSLTLLVFDVSSCCAQFTLPFDWNNPSGGAYSNQFNWSSILGGIPDTTNEFARFQINSTYSVQVSADYTVAGLVARQQGNVTLAFDPFSTFTSRKIYNTGALNLEPTAGGSVELNLSNGDVRVSGDTTVGSELSEGLAGLNLTNSLLTTAGTQVASGSASHGNVIVGATSQWTGSGPLVLGGDGEATLLIQASYRTSCFIICVTSAAQGFVSNASVTMAGGTQAESTANVYGVWNTGELVVGDQGSATVNVLATQLIAPNFINVSSVGALGSASANLGALPGSSGAVNVTGIALLGFTPIGSTWDVSGGLALGGDQTMAGGSGSLAIGSLNAVTVGANLKMWPGGELTLAENGQLSITGTAQLDGTLEFIIAGMTQPQLDDMFQILTAGIVTGTFSSAVLPTLDPGLRWDILYNPTNVMLKVVAGQAGDFDNDGDVDGRDFLVWQRGGSPMPLSTTDLAAWQANYGAPLIAAAAPVPEPGGLFLLSLVFVWQAIRRGAIRSSRTEFLG